MVRVFPYIMMAVWSVVSVEGWQPRLGPKPKAQAKLPPKTLGTSVGQWTISFGKVGSFSCMDCTNHALVAGTTQGYVANFPVENNLRIKIAPLSDGQPLLHAHAKGSFVAGVFFDPKEGKYVVRTKDLTGITETFQIFHKTHVVGGGFMRVHSDLCYFSLAIDGVYVVSSIRRGSIIKIGKIQDLVGDGATAMTTPTCVSVLEDGMVAVGTHDHRLYVINMERQEVNSASGHGPFAPLAIHAVPKRSEEGMRKPMYLLAWTSRDGHVTTGYTRKRSVGKKPVPIWVGAHEKVDKVPLVKIRITQNATMTVQSDEGKTLMIRKPGKREFVNDAWMMPIPCMDSFVWHLSEKGVVSLLFYEDEDKDVGKPEMDAVPCDS